MKTAVSIPAAVFQDAERMARRMGSSRSKLYSKALAEFVARHCEDKITEAMNAVVDGIGAEPDQFTRAAARKAMERNEW